jgi:hypothetical protein
MWIKDIHNIWGEGFLIVVDRLYSDHDAGITPNLAYKDVSRRFRNKFEIESESKQKRSQGSSAFPMADSEGPTFDGEGTNE